MAPEGTLNKEGQVEGGNEEGTIVVEGKAYTEKEVEELLRKETDLLRDYHKKTEDLAVDRESLKGKEAEAVRKLEEAEGLLTNVQRAQDADRSFFTTHAADEWDEYQSEIDNLAGGKKGKSKGEDKAVKELLEEVKSLREEVGSLRADTAGEKVDNSLKLAEGLCKGKYPLADFDAVKDRMFVAYSTNKKIPTEEEVRKMVEESHERVAGLDLVKRDSGEVEGLPAAGGGAPPEMPKDIPHKTDIDGDTDAGNKFFALQAAGRK